jgi:hypothetical protein
MSSTDHHTRAGSFADGQATRPPAAHARRGQFCTGQEQLADVVDLREGGFADGQASIPARLLPRGRWSLGQEHGTAAARSARPARTRAPHPALAEGEG